MRSWRSIMGVDSAEDWLAQNPQNEQKAGESLGFADIADFADSDDSDEALIQRSFRDGKPVRVWSGVLQEWIWWAPSKEIAERKKQETSEAVYHKGELINLIGWDKQSLKDMHVIKKSFDGEITK